MVSKRKDFLEGILVFAIMTGLLLPVRLVFVAYVSDNWFGSFGVISVISLIMLLLVKKGKLGPWGLMFERQINKIKQKRHAKIFYCQSIFLFLILGGTIYAIEQGNSEFVELKQEIAHQHQELSDKDQIIEQAKKIQPQEWIYGITGLISAIFFSFNELAAVLALLNDTFGGWILHFYTVALVEFLELFLILLVSSVVLPKKIKSTSASNKRSFSDTQAK